MLGKFLFLISYKFDTFLFRILLEMEIIGYFSPDTPDVIISLGIEEMDCKPLEGKVSIFFFFSFLVPRRTLSIES